LSKGKQVAIDFEEFLAIERFCSFMLERTTGREA